MNFERRNPFAPFTQREPPEPKRAEPSTSPSMPGAVKDPSELARRIVLAGKKRRNEVVEDTMPPVGSLGAAILAAAAKRDGK
jgi:hypothetical protein